MVSFGSLSQGFGNVVGSYKWHFSVCECSLNSKYTHRWWGHSNPNDYNKICLNFLQSTGSWGY